MGYLDRFAIDGVGVPASNGDSFFVKDVGTQNSVVLNPTPAITSYTYGMTYEFVPRYNSTGATTVNINGIGEKPLLDCFGNNINTHLSTSRVAIIQYDGTNWRLATSDTIWDGTPNNTINWDLRTNLLTFGRNKNSVTCYVKGSDGTPSYRDFETCIVQAPTQSVSAYLKIVFTKDANGIFQMVSSGVVGSYMFFNFSRTDYTITNSGNCYLIDVWYVPVN